MTPDGIQRLQDLRRELFPARRQKEASDTPRGSVTSCDRRQRSCGTYTREKDGTGFD